MSRLQPMLPKKFMGEACNHEIAVELSKMVIRVRRGHPGVWASALLKSLEHLADELPTLTENEIDPVIVASWQPTLYEVVDDEKEIHLCVHCKTAVVNRGFELCPGCAKGLATGHK